MKVLPQSIVLAAQGAQHVTRVPACVSLGQYGLESAWGAKETGLFNYFGVKALPGQAFRICATHEVVHGERVPVKARFRTFSSVAEAFLAHAELLATAPIYAGAMDKLPDWRAFVTEMAKHYATDPHYAADLIFVIESDDLTDYDIQLQLAA